MQTTNENLLAESNKQMQELLSIKNDMNNI